jgi:cytochrome P450
MSMSTNSYLMQNSEAAHTSMASLMLDSVLGDEQLVKDVAGVFYLAAHDTTVAAVTSFCLAVLVYPEVQKRVQEELDRVVGRSRLPEYSDKADLPYLDGVIRECFRWIPVVPQGECEIEL